MTNLEPSQIDVLTRLLQGQSVLSIAKALDVSSATVYRWVNSKEFQHEYSVQKAATLRRATNKLRRGMCKAIDQLVRFVEDETATPSIRLQAATKVIEFALRAVDTEDVLARLEELEAKITGA